MQPPPVLITNPHVPPFVKVAIGFAGATLWILARFWYVERTGLALVGLAGLVFLPFLVGLYVAVILFASSHRFKPLLAVFIFALVWCIPLAISGWTAYSDGTTQKMYERLVARPMPASVRNFKWGGVVGIDGSYVLTFQAEPEDMRRLVERLRLRLDDSYPAEEVNRRASNHCASYNMPFVPFAQPLSYCQTNETPAGWTRQLLTDAEHRRAYVFVQ